MNSGQTEFRHLAQSSLYVEDKIDQGRHSRVWGSFFDTTTFQWGYACCRQTARGKVCPLAARCDEQTLVPGPCDDDEDECRQTIQAWHDSMLLDSAPPDAVGVRDRYGSDNEFLACFILYWHHAWARTVEMDANVSPLARSKSIQGSKLALLLLMQQLKNKKVPRYLLENMADFTEFACKGEYKRSNDIYLNITIGKALWHSNLDLGQQRAHWGNGCSLRTMQRQVIEKDHKNSSLFDSDPTVQRYVHALKRLVTHMQSVQPSLDPSKAGHVPAPPASSAEVGLPVSLGVRDGAGKHERLPEYMDPDDPAFNGPSGSRGIAFGRRLDSTGLRCPSGRNSHPFAA